jgi:hypothetical protein
MLVAQMNTLDTLFNGLVRKAGFNLNDGYLPAAEMMLKLAFKAQSQARASAEALNDVINPRTTASVKNVAHNQQVNIGPRAEENENAPNELLEQNHGERLDFGAQGTAVEDDAEMATVGKSGRPKTRQDKKTASRNACKGGEREMLRELARLLRENDSMFR